VKELKAEAKPVQKLLWVLYFHFVFELRLRRRPRRHLQNVLVAAIAVIEGMTQE
jgi:hypothetical protein